MPADDLTRDEPEATYRDLNAVVPVKRSLGENLTLVSVEFYKD